PSTTPNLSEIIARELEEVETHQPSTPTTTRRPRNRKAPFQSHHQREDPGSTCAREVMLGEPVPSSSYHPGMIFLALHAEPAWTVKWSKKCPSTGFMKNTPYGRVMVKQRFFVVVARWHEHCVALPMFTHQGVGVARKPHRNEFVPVRDHRSTQSSPQMPYLWTKEMSDGAVVLHPLTHVQMSRPVSRDYSVPVTVMGRLDQRSMVLLVAMYAEYVRSALEMQVSGAL
ncbi:MAG: hypothetical protein M1833_006345, partial [Piccolia ochrophora]